MKSMNNISSSKPKTQNLLSKVPEVYLVPLNENEFVTDLIKKLNAKVVLVSRNY
jgi:hypothetical protein